MAFVNFTLEDVNYLVDLNRDYIDLSSEYRYEIFNQKSYPLCTVSTWITYIEYMRQINGLEYKRFSRIYQYYLSRVDANIEKLITGVNFSSSINALLKYGAVEETDYDDNFININSEPSSEIINIGKYRVESSSVSIRTLEINIDVFKVVLSVFKTPIAICGFFDKTKMRLNVKSIFTKDDLDMMYHSVCIVGYNDMDRTFKFQNSFGEHWHDHGFGYISYDFIRNIKNAICLSKSIIKDQSVMSEDDINNEYINLMLELINLI